MRAGFQNFNLELRGVMHAQRVIVGKIALIGDAVGKSNLAHHCRRQPIDRPTDHLCLDRVRVQRGADIADDPDFVDPDCPVFVNNLDHLGHRRAKGIGECHAAPDIGRGLPGPAGQVAYGRDDPGAGRMFAGGKVQPELQWVGPGGMGQLVKEAFHHEAVDRRAHRPPEPQRHS